MNIPYSLNMQLIIVIKNACHSKYVFEEDASTHQSHQILKFSKHTKQVLLDGVYTPIDKLGSIGAITRKHLDKLLLNLAYM